MDSEHTEPTSQPTTTPAREQITEWRTVASDQTVLGARDVQDRLLDLYPAVKDSAASSSVQRYLTLTRERTLFDPSEIEQLLDEIESSLPELSRS